MKERPYSYLVDAIIPQYIKDEYPNYIAFIKKYLEAIESESGPVGVLYSLPEYIDINSVNDDSLIYYIKQYISSFPATLLNDLNVKEFIKNAKVFYSNKGNEESLKFIFNLLNKKIKIKYPAESIFILNQSELDNSKYLHDNFYYAYYTYEVETDLDIGIYEDLVKNTMHPIGVKVFANKIIEFPDIGNMEMIIPRNNEEFYIEEQNHFNTNSRTGVLDNRDIQLVYSSSPGMINNYIILSGTIALMFWIDELFTGTLVSSVRTYDYYLTKIEDLFSYKIKDFYDFDTKLFFDGIYPKNDLEPTNNLKPLSLTNNDVDTINVQRSANLDITS